MHPVFAADVLQAAAAMWNGGLKTSLEVGGGIVAFLISKEVLATIVGEFVSDRLGDTYKKVVRRHSVKTSSTRVRTLKIITVKPKHGSPVHHVTMRDTHHSSHVTTDSTETTDGNGHKTRQVKVTR